MRLWQPLVLSFMLAASAIAQTASTPTGLNEEAVPGVMARAVDEVIRPGYRNMQQSTARLTTAMKDLCEGGTQQTLDKAKSAFDDTIRYWSIIEIVQTGPVMHDNLFEHILFFPDRKGVGLRQVQALLAKADPKDATVDSIGEKSVALQGLTALEYVLYGNGSDDLLKQKNGFRCQYGAAVAGNIQREAGEVVAAWEKPDGVQASWKRPGPQSEDFMDNKEAVTALLGILVHGVETVRDQRLELFYKGRDDTAPRPRMAIYWRSKNTWKSMTANLEGLRTLWQKAGMAELLPADKKPVADAIEANFKTLLDTVPKLNPDIDVATSDAEKAKLDAFLATSRELITRISDEYGGAIGLSAGFSFSDGD
ncbi:imelysin family protein [Rhizobium sp. CC1099]|uniref:imelysin family protein n=1 Tax=Rhizobium sp. CC1099 TaxID=3039160 RepID=UPI0024B0C195|nr:imelysin family protein [Rhizobium sp. CC1099]WFU87474.1 imelysin family protein [Rhizobium sp. CC1099]